MVFLNRVCKAMFNGFIGFYDFFSGFTMVDYGLKGFA